MCFSRDSRRPSVCTEQSTTRLPECSSWRTRIRVSWSLPRTGWARCATHRGVCPRFWICWDGGKAVSKVKPNELREARVNPWRLLRMTIPGTLHYWIKDHLPAAVQDWLLFRWYSGGKNWKNCKAFSIPNNDSVGAIRLSVKGRGRYGQISPGEEYERMCR